MWLRGQGFRVQGSRFRGQGLEIEGLGLGFGVQGAGVLGFEALWCKIALKGVELRVRGLGV